MQLFRYQNLWESLTILRQTRCCPKNPSPTRYFLINPLLILIIFTFTYLLDVCRAPPCFHILMMCFVILHISFLSFTCLTLSLSHIIMSHVKYKRSKNKNFYSLLKSFFLSFKLCCKLLPENRLTKTSTNVLIFFPFLCFAFFVLFFSRITITNVYENDFHALTSKLLLVFFFFMEKNFSDFFFASSQVIWIGSFKELIGLSVWEKIFMCV